MQVCFVNACEHYGCAHSPLKKLPRKRVQINDTDREILHAGREIGKPTKNLIIYIHRSPRMWGFICPHFPKAPRTSEPMFQMFQDYNILNPWIPKAFYNCEKTCLVYYLTFPTALSLEVFPIPLKKKKKNQKNLSLDEGKPSMIQYLGLVVSPICWFFLTGPLITLLFVADYYSLFIGRLEMVEQTTCTCGVLSLSHTYLARLLLSHLSSAFLFV